MANVIARVNRPALVIAPNNKTLAAQLYGSSEFFPDNGALLRSYYDYYQPEAYVPSTDTFIEKDSSINDRSTRCALRRPRRCSSATTHDRRQRVVHLRSGSPESQMLVFRGGAPRPQRAAAKLIDIQYQQRRRLSPRHVPVRGDVVEIFPGVRGRVGAARRVLRRRIGRSRVRPAARREDRRRAVPRRDHCRRATTSRATASTTPSARSGRSGCGASSNCGGQAARSRASSSAPTST